MLKLTVDKSNKTLTFLIANPSSPLPRPNDTLQQTTLLLRDPPIP